MAGESRIQSKVVRHAIAQGIIARKLSWGEGWPDYMFLYLGQICFIEFKDIGESLRPLQRHMVPLLRNKGFRVGIMDNVEDGIAFINSWKQSVEDHHKQLERLL